MSALTWRWRSNELNDIINVGHEIDLELCIMSALTSTEFNEFKDKRPRKVPQQNCVMENCGTQAIVDSPIRAA